MRRAQEKKREKPAAADSSHSLQALSPWRQHKDILFCFRQLPHSIQSDNERARGGGNDASRSLVCPEELLCDLTGRYEGLVTFWFESLNELE